MGEHVVDKVLSTTPSLIHSAFVSIKSERDLDTKLENRTKKLENLSIVLSANDNNIGIRDESNGGLGRGGVRLIKRR